MPLVMGIDSSTQSTKVEVRDVDDGTLVGFGSAAHSATTPPLSEQDPHEWWRALEQAYREADVDARAVDAISVAGQQHGLVALDDLYDVVRPAKLWNDTQSAPDADWLISQLDGGAAAWAKACGSVPVAAFTIAKLSWLHRSEADSWNRLARACLPHDWLTYRLTGEFVTDRGDASGTGYWSCADEEYRFDLLALVDADRDWTSALPTVLAPTELAGATRAFDLDAVVACGTGDNMAAALGCAQATGDVTISIGTSGTVHATSATPTADEAGAVAGFADATGQFLPLVCTLNAAKVTDAFARLLAVSPDELDRLALAAEPGSGGLTLVPYFDGERTPNRPNASGTLAGLRSDVAPPQVARAAYEGVVCGLLDGLDALRGAGVAVSGDLRLVGGGARSEAYRQIVADLAGRAVTVPRAHEHVALGACVQAAAALSNAGFEEVGSAWGLGLGSVTEPSFEGDPGAVRDRYRSARDAIVD